MAAAIRARPRPVPAQPRAHARRGAALNAPLRGRHALVTGASRGIGAAIARALADAGARVSLVARDEARLTALAGALRAGGAEAAYAVADVTDERALDAAFASAKARYGAVDVLACNAGAARAATFAKTDGALWAEMLAINLTSAYRCARAVAGEMLQRRFGRIVNVASIAGLRGEPYVSAYTAAKHGVVGLTRALAAEFAATGVTVNAVCPGYTETDLLAGAVANVVRATGRDEAAARDALLAQARQARFVEPAEVARTVAWLCDPGSGAITGQAIAILAGAP